MGKKRSLLAVLIIFGIIMMYQPSFVFGGPFDGVMKLKGGGGASKGDINHVYKLVTDADGLLLASLRITSKMLLNKEECDKFENDIKAIESKTDPKEKDAEMRKVISDQASLIEKEAAKDEAASKIDSLSVEQKKLFGKSIFNILLAALKDKEAVVKSQNLLQKIQANPASATSFSGDLPKIKDIVSSLPSQTEKVVSLGSALTKLSQKSKIEVVVPKGSDEKPEKVDI